jgi:homoserine kinase
MNDLVQIATFPTRLDAETAQRLLVSFGIRSIVHADDAGGAYGIVLSGGGARLLVQRRDAKRARETLKEV